MAWYLKESPLATRHSNTYPADMTVNDLYERRGFIAIQDIRHITVNELAAVFSECLPILCQQDHKNGPRAYVYECLSRHFDPVPVGNICPRYTVTFHQKSESTPLAVTFNKEDY